MKRCTLCDKYLLESAFGKDNHHKDGLRSQCRECRSAYDKAHCHLWPSQQGERKRRVRALSSKRHPETKRIRDQRYKKKNREKCRIRSLTFFRHKTPQPCSIPSCSKPGHRHHLSYDGPENFVWLCPEHHQDQHAPGWLAMKGDDDGKENRKETS